MGALVDFLWGAQPLITLQSWLPSGPGWTALAHALSRLGDTAGLILLFSLLRWRAGRLPALGLVALFFLAGMVNMGLWQLVSLPRPAHPELVVRTHPAVSSFPSGHTVTALVLFGWLALRGQLPAVVPWLVVPLVGLTRLYQGTHYVGDVLVGGLLVGLFVLWLHTRLWPPLVRWGARRGFRFFLFSGTALVALVSLGTLLFSGDKRAWQVLGATAGLVLGVLVDWRLLGKESPTLSHARRPGEVWTGLLVLVALLAFVNGVSVAAPLHGLFYFLATVWGALGLPWALARQRSRECM